MPTTIHPRTSISPTLHGDVLEIGPGFQPFPTAPGARVTYLDRPVEGGRDATWPELVGVPHGPQGDIDADLDVDGLSEVADASFDVVIASHVIEHLANPLKALVELQRVLRPGGRLVLIVPDRHHTFDSARVPTPFAHVLEEYHAGVTEVDEAHIREFCAALYAGPKIHPDDVRAWHDPDRLDAELFELHRRRTIHVHVWNPQEFAVLLTGALGQGLGSFRLESAYFVDDIVGRQRNECGFVLVRTDPMQPVPAGEAAQAFIRAFVDSVLDTPGRDLTRVSGFVKGLADQLGGSGIAGDIELAPALAAVSARLVARVEQAQARLEVAKAERVASDEAAKAADARLSALRASPTYRVGRVAGAPLRRIRRRVGR